MLHSLSADQEAVRKINRSLVLNMLRLHAPISRAEVANLTGLNRSTVSNITGQLIDEGLIWELDSKGSKIGRPSISLNLRPDGGAVIGVEINVDFISVLLTDFVAQPIWQDCFKISAAMSQIEVLKMAEQSIEKAMKIAEERRLRLLGIGVGLPGMVNVQRGELIFAPNLGWRNVPLRLMWNQRFRLPVYVENEANLAALGEYYFGVARQVEHFLYLSSGIGLGGGVIINGKVFRGGHGFAGEVGHIQRDPQGELCACGRRGCWETQVGPRAVVQRLQKIMKKSPGVHFLNQSELELNSLTFEKVVEAALMGDPLCREAIEEVAVNLAVGIADLANLFNPELIVIGGALTMGRDILIPVIEKTVASEALPPSIQNVRIAISDHGKDACVLGAVAVVLDDIVREIAIV